MLPKTRSDQSRPLAQRMSSLFPLLALSVYVPSRRCPIRAGDHGFRGVGEPQNHRTYGVCVTYPKVLSAPVGEAPVHTHEKNDETADGVNDASSADTSEATAPVAEPPAVAPTPGPEKAGTGGMPGSSPPRGVRRRGRRGGGPGGRDGSGGGRTDVQVRSFFACAFFFFFFFVICQRGLSIVEGIGDTRLLPRPGDRQNRGYSFDGTRVVPFQALLCTATSRRWLVGWLVGLLYTRRRQRPTSSTMQKSGAYYFSSASGVGVLLPAHPAALFRPPLSSALGSSCGGKDYANEGTQGTPMLGTTMQL